MVIFDRAAVDESMGGARRVQARVAFGVSEATPARRPTWFALVGVLLGALGVTAPAFAGPSVGGTTSELIFLASFALAAGLWLSFVTLGRFGMLVVINPAVCFAFALMLSWGVVPAIGAHLTSVAVLTWRWRLPLTRGLLLTAQFLAAYAVAYGILRLGGTQGPRGEEWTSIRDAEIVGAAAVAWLAVYTLSSYLLAAPASERLGIAGLTSTGGGLLFNAALVVLSPVVAVTAERSVALSALILLPLYATQRMARLAAERERADRLDSLTLLASRTALREDFDRIGAVGSSQRRPGQLVVILLNLDRFKYINNSLGYELGDQLLVAVGHRLRSISDNVDATASRLGADEFAILVWMPDLDQAKALAWRAVEAVREPIRVSGLLLEVTVSAGVAARTNPDDDFVRVLRHADSAMQDAKRRGNDVTEYRGHAPFSSAEGLQLLADFREALTATDDRSIAMHYQPQVNMVSGAVEGLEALLRWTHPVHGPIDAGTILLIAEQTPVMDLLTTRVIDEVTAQVQRWRSEALVVRVSFNISTRDLYSDRVVTQLAQYLQRHHVPARQLQVEVTESALTSDPVRARRTLRAIAEMGIDIALDDFGTGFSSLQQIRGTPLSEIKVDQTFVRGMANSREDAAIVASTINLAHSLGLRTVAEGIEDEQTRARLIDIGCDLGQGWLFAKALPAQEIPAFIAHRSAHAPPDADPA